jgi:PAS domain S-box-containing protein
MRHFHRNKKSIWLVLASVIGLATFLSFIVLGMYMASEQRSIAEEEIHEITRSIATNISSAVANDILEERFDHIEELLLRSVTISNIQEIVVADAQGKIISKVTRDQRGLGKPDYTKRQINADLSLPSTSQTAEEYRYSIAIERGARLGMVVVASSLQHLEKVNRHIFFDTARAAFLAILLNFVLLWLGLRSMVKGLSLSTKFTTQLPMIKGSQLGFESKITEINSLVIALNAMSTELASQHQKLNDNEIRKSAILAGALDCFISIDDQGHIMDFNPAAEKTFGYTASEVIGQPLHEIIIPPSMREAHKAGMRRFSQTKKSQVLQQRLEMTAIRKNGTEFPIEMTIVGFEIDQRQYFSGYIRDISTKKQMEEENTWTHRLLSQMMKELEYQKFALDQHSIVSIADAAGKITYINDIFSAISGYSEAEVLGQDHRMLKSGLHSAAFYQDMWEHISTGKVWHGQIANRTKGGSIYWVESTIVPWLDENGIPYQYISIRTDITKQKENERALAEARKRELATGFEIQRSLLWGTVPDLLTKTAISTYSEASQGVDGDFFAFTRYSDTCFELLVGDVMGKGIPAAMIGAAVKNSYSQILTELLINFRDNQALPSPAEIINALHYSLTPRLIALNSFVTLALYRFDSHKGELTFVNAGHTAGLLLQKHTQKIQSILGDNLPIGVLKEEIYVERSMPITFGDLLFAYSDGITETRDHAGNEYGESLLVDHIEACNRAALPPALILQLLRLELRTFSSNESLSDDQTAIAVQLSDFNDIYRDTKKDRQDGMDVIEIPWRLKELRILREEIARVASLLDLPDDRRDQLILAAFESATNVIRHSPTQLADQTLHMKIIAQDDAVIVELLYVGMPFTPPSSTTPDFSGGSDGGFGLYIIQQAVDQVSYSEPFPGVCSIRLLQHYVEEDND